MWSNEEQQAGDEGDKSRGRERAGRCRRDARYRRRAGTGRHRQAQAGTSPACNSRDQCENLRQVDLCLSAGAPTNAQARPRPKSVVIMCVSDDQASTNMGLYEYGRAILSIRGGQYYGLIATVQSDRYGPDHQSPNFTPGQRTVTRTRMAVAHGILHQRRCVT
jgi:hypothetical protein